MSSTLKFNPVVGGVEVQVDGIKVAQFNPTGTATELTSGLKFPATQVPSADANTLDDYAEGSFTATLTGCTTAPTITIRYVKVGKMVTLTPDSTGVTGTSNSSSKTLTGMPSILFPSAVVRSFYNVTDNGGTPVVGALRVETTGVLTISATVGGAGFAASGTCTIYPLSISYSL